MLDSRANSIEYEAQRKLVSKTEELVLQRRNGKYSKSKWKNLIEAARYLDILGLKTHLDSEDLKQLTYIYECLLSKLELNNLPANPGVSVITIPQVLAGIPGPPGDDGEQGPKGDTGGGRDFNAGTITVTTTVDSFSVSSAYAARWDYIINGTAQRAGTILATWTEDGGSVQYNDYSTADANGDTSGIELSVSYASSTISLVATITSGTWAVSGTRYWIPNTGNYTPPIGSTLSSGYMFIGNNLNIAQERLLSGDVTVGVTGTTLIGAGAVTNAKIAAAAGISLNKLAALTASLVAVTDTNGFLTTLAGITPTKLGYLTDVTSNIQAQFTGKQNTITGAATTITSLDLTPGYVLVSDGTLGKVAISGTLATKLAFLNGVTSDIQTQLDNKADIGSAALNSSTFNIGAWNMDATSSITVAHGIASGRTRIKAVSVKIYNDAGNFAWDFSAGPSPNNDAIIDWNDTIVGMSRVNGGGFDSIAYDDAVMNRGEITVFYTP